MLGRLSVTLPGGEAVEFRVLDVSPKTEADEMNVTASLEVSVSFLEAQNTSGGKITPSDDLVKRAAEQAANDLRERLYECHALSLEKDADFCSCKTRSTKGRLHPPRKLPRRHRLLLFRFRDRERGGLTGAGDFCPAPCAP